MKTVGLEELHQGDRVRVCGDFDLMGVFVGRVPFVCCGELMALVRLDTGCERGFCHSVVVPLQLALAGAGRS